MALLAPFLMHAIDVEIWAHGGLRCVMRPSEHGWEVRVMRAHDVIKSDRFEDGAMAVAAADDWRHRLGLEA